MLDKSSSTYMSISHIKPSRDRKSRLYVEQFLRRNMSILGLIFLLGSALAYTDREKEILFADCKSYDNSDLYDGLICGTDAVTYSNSVYLECLNYKNSESPPVATMHTGPCLHDEEFCRPNPIYEPVCGSDGNTYSNKESLLCYNSQYRKNVTVVSVGDCVNVDYCSQEFSEEMRGNTVCASNGFTYKNVAEVKCLQKFGSPIKIVHDGGCTTAEVYKMYGIKGKCCEIAAVRSERNPVCASDNVTYHNPFVFLCSHHELSVVYNGPCNTLTKKACVLAHTNDVYENGVVTNKDFTVHDEVCGTDGRIYKSKYHLQCSTRYNNNLFLKRVGQCSGPDDDPCGAIQEADTGTPVCGSDGVSYVSADALWCVKRHLKPKLVYAHDGPC